MDVRIADPQFSRVFSLVNCKFTIREDGYLEILSPFGGILIPPGMWSVEEGYFGTEVVEQPQAEDHERKYGGKRKQPQYIHCEWCGITTSAGTAHGKRFCTPSCYQKWWRSNGRKGLKPRKCRNYTE